MSWESGRRAAEALAAGDKATWARNALGWDPHAGQEEWLGAPDVLEKVLLTGRRWGKSEGEAVDLTFDSQARPGPYAVISITMDQARLIWDQAHKFTTESPILSRAVHRIRETPFPLIQFKNGSSITARSVARNGLYIRGHKYRKVVIDEADYIPEVVIDDVVRMTLADYAGTLVMTTTPKPKRGLVYRTVRRWNENQAEEVSLEQGQLYVKSGSTFENPHVSHEYIEKQRQRMTRGAWMREVEGQYSDEDDSFFRWEDIELAYSLADWRLPDPWDRRKTYALGADVAKKQDWTTIFVLDTTYVPYRLVYFDRFNRLPWPMVGAKIKAVIAEYHISEGQAQVDATGIGEAVMDALRGVASGYVFTKQSKIDLLTTLQLTLENHDLLMPFEKQVVDELQMYEIPDDDIVTDCVMGLALAVWAAKHGRSRRPVGV